jgi:hypothetical protein
VSVLSTTSGGTGVMTPPTVQLTERDLRKLLARCREDPEVCIHSPVRAQQTACLPRTGRTSPALFIVTYARLAQEFDGFPKFQAFDKYPPFNYEGGKHCKVGRMAEPKYGDIEPPVKDNVAVATKMTDEGQAIEVRAGWAGIQGNATPMH